MKLSDFRFHIGKRTLKTSVSAAAAMLIADALHLEFPSLAVVAAIIILQPTFHETIDYAAKRMIGTLIGCALGLISIYVVHINVTADVFLGTLVLIMVANAFSITDAGILGLISFVSIVTDPGATILTVSNRIINTSIGAATSIAMNLIFPVQQIESKSLVISFRILRLDTKLLRENLNILLGNSTLNEDELSDITDEIIAEFNQAYKFKLLMEREQKFASDLSEYNIFNERYNILWDIHSAILQIHNNRDKMDFEMSDILCSEIQEVIYLLDDIIAQKNTVPPEVYDRLLFCVDNLDLIITEDMDFVYNNEEAYNKVSYLTVLLTSLKGFLETIRAFTN